jgi:pyruvate-formate lyase
MSSAKLRKELKNYYLEHSFHEQCKGKHNNYQSPLWDMMDEYASEHPELSAVQLKAAQYEIIAEEFQPVIFKNSPFYSEMGLKISESDGVPSLSTGGWLFNRNAHLFRDINPDEYDKYVAADRNGIHLSYGPYVDYDHHCFPYTNVMENGLENIYKQAETALKLCVNIEETEFIECAMRGLLAVKRISEKFADAAETLKKCTYDEVQKRFLGMIAKTAREVPWRKPENFYEGLCAIWFLHEVSASIEGVGFYVIGHLDRMLGEFYRHDLASGCLSENEAYDLICRFMIYTDCKFDSFKSVDESFNRQEMGETLILGGCDENGREVCNDLTFMILKAHYEHKLIYPKIHCRISKNSNQEYLDAINRDFLHGRNVISFLNDDCLIPAQVKAGKQLKDARRYVAGGCWEVMLEGHEHSAGANCYLNLARIMDMSIHEHHDVEVETGIVCNKISGAKDFETVYRIVMGNIICSIRQTAMTIGKNGSIWSQVNPAPFFSACLSDCLKNRKDYTAGGGRYNPHGMPLTNLAVLVDSLLAIRKLCFEDNHYSLTELLMAVKANWEGYDVLRAEALTLPHFGDNSTESNELAECILNEIYENTRDLINERGGSFQLGLYSYRDIIDWAKITCATPNGRRTGDFLSQGLTPSRLHRSAEITSTINSASALDLTNYPANSIMTVSLPLGGINLQALGALERVFASAELGMLQLNCIDKAQLLDAQAHPGKHEDLIVRLYGYSARFVNLTQEMQHEFISRNIYG